jgi:glycosyltransferase involved in cell wall biosynthesis
LIINKFLDDKRICYIYQKNKGFSGANNTGILKSKGKVIGFIGQDDIWISNKLDTQIKYLSENSDIDLLHSNYSFINDSDDLIDVRRIKISEFGSRKELIKNLFLNNFIGFETVIIKRGCFDKLGLFDENMIAFSDHDLWIRMAGTFKFKFLNLNLVKKREHAFQLSKTKILNAINDEFLITKKGINLYPFLKKLERKKLASLNYSYGIILLKKGNITDAKRRFHEAILLRPFMFKSIIAYFMPSVFRIFLNKY